MMRLLTVACLLAVASAIRVQQPDATVVAAPGNTTAAKRKPSKKKGHGTFRKLAKAAASLGKEADSVFKSTKSEFSDAMEPSKLMSEALNKKCSGEHPADAPGAVFLLDNSRLQAETSGIGFRFTKRLFDKDLGKVAHWGTEVRGTPHEDGWLQVGECFLPMLMKGTPVMSATQL
mmetsp:Transcript_64271/g.144506  ORF Transcript_64271/g.144506 Transcript_64271/m.144506 type:complete len:175 (-) Transcript_64271:203-727(-)